VNIIAHNYVFIDFKASKVIFWGSD